MERISGNRSERGASLAEYALLLALIAVVSIASMALLGGSASSKFEDAASRLDSEGSAGGGGAAGPPAGGGGGGGATTTTTPPATVPTTQPAPTTTTTTTPPAPKPEPEPGSSQVPVSAGFSDTRATATQGKKWKAEATINLVDTNHTPVDGWAKVKVIMYTKRRDDAVGQMTVVEREIPIVGGKGYLVDAGLAHSTPGNNPVVQSVTYEVIEVHPAQEGTEFTWATPRPSVIIDRP